MTELPVDIKFRLEAAARVLERAANRTQCKTCREKLLGLATKLRQAAQTGDLSALERSVEVQESAESSLERTIEEVRRWIWSFETKPETKPEPRISLPFFRPLEEFERFLEEMDKRLMELLP